MRTSYLLLVSATLVAFGQTQPAELKIGELVTDRPDFTESTEIAPKGWLQVESGFQFDKAGNTYGYTFGAPLLRLGLARKFELRLATDGVVGMRDKPDPIRRGLADSSIGFKYKFVNESKWLPAMSIIPSITLPTGHPMYTSKHVDPGAKFAMAKDVPLGFSVSGNINYGSLSDPLGRYHQSAATLSVGHGFGERFSGYWELYTFNCDERSSGRMTVAQTGLAAAIGKNTQLDITVGRRLTSVGPDWLFAFGWATRHPLSPSTWFKR